MSEEVCTCVSQRLRGAPAPFLLTDEVSRTDKEATPTPKRCRNFKLGKIRTQDTHVVHRVKYTVFTSQGEASIYEDMSLVLFANAYLAIVSAESAVMKGHMLVHLQELFEDVEVYQWKSVREYHAAWLQVLEQGWAAWGDEVRRAQLHCLMVWSKLSLSARVPPAPPNSVTFTNTRDPRHRVLVEDMDLVVFPPSLVTGRVQVSVEASILIAPLIPLNCMCDVLSACCA